MTKMADHGVGVALTNVRIQDDIRALEHQPLADCHVLRILHRIRLRGGALAAYNDDPSLLHPPPLNFPVVESDEHLTAADVDPSKACSGRHWIWSWFMDLLIIYAAIVVTYLLYEYIKCKRNPNYGIV